MGSRSTITAGLLVAPLLIFLLVVFVLPISMMLWRSVDNPEIRTILPRTVAALGDWDGEALPGEPAFAALVEDLKSAGAQRTSGTLGRRLNFQNPGNRTLIRKLTARAENVEAPYREALIAIDEDIGKLKIWHQIKSNSGRLTPDYLLASVDLRHEDGAISPVDASRAIHIRAMLRTFGISATVVAACLVLAFPIAFLMAAVPPFWTKILMGFVLLPFWMSLLARTASWVALLQSEGVINRALISLNMIAEPIPLVFNRSGVLIAMTHVLLPYMILPLYANLRTIPETLVRAGLSLGASPLRVFLTVYLPGARPGLIAGALLVAILSLGYYITPALVGGPRDQMIAYFIAFNTSQVLNWGLAAALSTLLLVSVLAIYVTFRMLQAAVSVKDSKHA